MNKGIAGSEFLRGLIATDRIEIRVARRLTPNYRDIYHEKIGVFSDNDENVVAFSGSTNESQAAYIGNFERIDVFFTHRSEDRRRAFAIKEHFEDLWNNKTDGVEVLHLIDALKQKVFVGRVNLPGEREDNLVDDRDEERNEINRGFPEILVPASGITPRDHQRAAIRAWASAGGRGILEMATGSGKTITALTLASKLYDSQGPPLAILIIVPLIHLADQWCQVAKMYGLDPIRCAGSMNQWHQPLSAGIDSVNSGRRPVISAVTTNKTMQSGAFQRLVSRIRVPFLVIADEMHNYGATASFDALPENAAARIGLSATPDRAYDEVGNKRLKSYFGDTVFTYGLKEALNDHVLTPYRYFPTVVNFNESEADTFIELTERIIKLVGDDTEEDSISDARKMLLIRRARVVAAATSKIPRLRQLLESHRSDTHIFVYCGDGSVEGPDDGELVRQVDHVITIIGQELGMRCARYTAETPPPRRQELLKQFAQGEIQVLVAIRCLDEGVDVPSTRTAFMLASSTNPRQFVQRRGRVLRQHEGKKRAEIFDFFVSFPKTIYTKDHPSFQIARGLIRNQLSRALEFASLAENGPQARNELLALKAHFQLLAEG